MSYRPRRMPKRFLDADCPQGVLAILDDPRAIDRYTVIYAEPVTDDGRTFQYVAMNAAPFHPQGFGQHGEMDASSLARYRYENSRFYAKWSDLPEDCKRLIRQDLAA
jgi:hypothetical protein